MARKKKEKFDTVSLALGAMIGVAAREYLKGKVDPNDNFVPYEWCNCPSCQEARANSKGSESFLLKDGQILIDSVFMDGKRYVSASDFRDYVAKRTVNPENDTIFLNQLILDLDLIKEM